MRYVMALLLAVFTVFTISATPADAQKCTAATLSACPSPNYNAPNVANLMANALAFGADNTGINDASTAINNAAATGRDVYLPAGTYYIKNSINIGPNQCLIGNNRTSSIITVDQNFSSGAAGVILYNGREVTGTTRAGCIEDLQIQFAQPQTQAVRANFQSLGICTSGSGGTGCKYPWAINQVVGSPFNRLRIENVAITGAWDGINESVNSGGNWITNVEMGALDVGLDVENNLDFSHVSGYHFWPFGFSGSLASGVYQDTNTVAIKLGQCDGCEFTDISVLSAQIDVLSTATSGIFNGLGLDSGASLQVAGGELMISNIYANGNSTDTPGGKCAVNVTGGETHLTDFVMGSAVTDACVAGGGELFIVGGRIANLVQIEAAATVGSGGRLIVHNLDVDTNPANTWTPAMFQATGTGIMQATGVTFPTTSVTPGIAFVIATDNAENFIANNNLNGWTFFTPGTLGGYGPNGNVDFNSDYSLQSVAVSGGLRNSTGTFNTGIGYRALYANTTGSANTGVGGQAGTSITTGTGNTAVGEDAALNMTTGAGNTAIGNAACQMSSAITRETCVGFDSLFNASGANNTSIGWDAGLDVTSGLNNTILGYSVGSGVLGTGSFNILVGTGSNVDTPTAGTSNYLDIGQFLIGDLVKDILVVNQAVSGAPVITGCGSGSPLIGSGSGNVHGTITEGTSATGCTITWANAFHQVPDCVVSSPSGLASLTYVVSTSALTITNSNTSNGTVSYVCIEGGVTP